MLLKCYHHLHPLFGNVVVDQGVDEDYSLDTFEMTTSTSEPTKKLVNRELPTIFLNEYKFDIQFVKIDYYHICENCLVWELV
jgi:hypothetical protein